MSYISIYFNIIQNISIYFIWVPNGIHIFNSAQLCHVQNSGKKRLHVSLCRWLLEIIPKRVNRTRRGEQLRGCDLPINITPKTGWCLNESSGNLISHSDQFIIYMVLSWLWRTIDQEFGMSPTGNLWHTYQKWFIFCPLSSICFL